MPKKSISFQDLMEECEFTDEKEFRRILNRNGYQLRRHHPIEKEAADEIMRRLTGRDIDWYKRRQEDKDQQHDGPIRRQQTDEIVEIIQTWFERLGPPMPTRDCIIGVVTHGGFLSGIDDDYFLMPLSEGINIFIGDRGSGKSTALSMCGALSPSITEATSALVSSLLATFTHTTIDSTHLARELRNRVRRYGIDRYACFYHISGQTCAVYVDLEKNIYATARVLQGCWTFVNDNPFHNLLPIQMLVQGEVHRISEPENQFFLTNMLDALYSQLREARQKLALHVSKFIRDQYATTTPTLTTPTNSDLIRPFFDLRFKEMRKLQLDADQPGGLGVGSLDTLSVYIQRYRDARKVVSMDVTKLNELLDHGEDGAWIIFIEPIHIFLLNSMDQCDELRAETPRQTIIDKVRSDILRSQDTQPSIPVGLPNDGFATPITQRMAVSTARESSYAAMDCDLPSLARVHSQRIVDFITDRLRATAFADRTYSTKRPIFSESLNGLMRQYCKLRKRRRLLHDIQQKFCKETMLRVNRGVDHIRIGCAPIDSDSPDVSVIEGGLNQLGEHFDRITSAPVTSPMRRLREAVAGYDNIVTPVLRHIDNIRADMAEASSPSFLFFPIDITFQQGNAWRPFDRLSFGQKSGIILRIMVTGTTSRILIIDQPEDNLDATAIGVLLLPSLREFAEERQVILATHSSQLALGLTDARIMVMESTGDTGRLRHRGLADDSFIVDSLLNILEGGIHTFDLKLKTFDEFVSRLRQRVRDMDINLIESSFRRRTIDERRNVLQPPISDEDLLSMLRHELKQRPPLQITGSLEATSRAAQKLSNISTEYAELVECLNGLCRQLGVHIGHFQGSIEDLRLMDTHPQPEHFSIHQLLDELSNQFQSQVSAPRILEIALTDALRYVSAYADPKHVRLVFRNLLNNALRATELRRWALPQSDRGLFVERISMTLDGSGGESLPIIFADNGCGIAPDIRNRLYQVRCSDQFGKEHALGGIIIKKLLDINGGGISIISSECGGVDSGSVQRITLLGRAVPA